MNRAKPFFPGQAFHFALLLSAVTLLFLAIPTFLIGNKELFLWINQNLTPVLGQAAKVPSFLGESAAMGLLLLASLRFKASTSLLIAFTWLSGAIHSWIFKLWLCKGWPRPYQHFLENKIGINLVAGVKIHHWNSFPSGHTITAFSILMMMPVLFPDIKKRFIFLSWILAMSCGFSRILLVQHWPQDVIGGIILGCSAAWLSQAATSKLLKNINLPEIPLPTLLRNVVMANR